MLLKSMIWLTSMAKVACACAIMGIVAMKLYNVDVAVSTGTQTATPKYACLMTDEVDNPAVCNYALVAGTFSLIASLAVSILQCVTCELCGCGSLLDFIFGVAGAAWWLLAALVFKRFGDQADQKNLPGADYRMQVQYLAYALVPLFAFVSVVALFKGMASLCGGGSKERGYERETV